MNSIRVLHITAHLGGGVGRALSELTRYRISTGSRVKDTFVCLEPPETTRYADAIVDAGAELHIAPSAATLDSLLAHADIVQLEWWHHPLLAGWMNRLQAVPMRTIVWSHISGLHYPAIPPAFVGMPHAFVCTSDVSREHLKPAQDPPQNIVQAVSSTGGFDDLPLLKRDLRSVPRFAYLGSLNPAKLHPEVTDYLNAVDIPNFSVNFFGDASANPQLRRESERAGDSARFVLRGYTEKPSAVFGEADVLVYLLNPTHYGTTENALIEAMACGVVPVVLDNPVEKSIVRDGETGIVVNSPQSFADAISFLYRNPSERLRMSAAASLVARELYSVRKSAGQLDAICAQIIEQPKRPCDFESVFGKTPSDWFLSCIGQYAHLFQDNMEHSARAERLQYQFLYEATKSSAFHFASYFPSDTRLAHWTAMLESDLASQRLAPSPEIDIVLASPAPFSPATSIHRNHRV